MSAPAAGTRAGYQDHISVEQLLLLYDTITNTDFRAIAENCRRSSSADSSSDSDSSVGSEEPSMEHQDGCMTIVTKLGPKSVSIRDTAFYGRVQQVPQLPRTCKEAFDRCQAAMHATQGDPLKDSPDFAVQLEDLMGEQEEVVVHVNEAVMVGEDWKGYRRRMLSKYRVGQAIAIVGMDVVPATSTVRAMHTSRRIPCNCLEL
jgi:hypothetical protein